MSITISTDVFCDECLEWVDGVTGPRPRRADAYKQARKYGWKRVNGKDLCPKCASLTKKEPTP